MIIRLSITQNIFVSPLGMLRDYSIQYLHVFAEISTEFIINLTGSPPSTTTLMRMSEMVSADPFIEHVRMFVNKHPLNFHPKRGLWKGLLFETPKVGI